LLSSWYTPVIFAVLLACVLQVTYSGIRDHVIHLTVVSLVAVAAEGSVLWLTHIQAKGICIRESVVTVLTSSPP
jgi:hypothetical protein